MTRITTGIFAFAFAWACLAPARADSRPVDVSERTEYYDVRASTEEGLVEQMGTLGPVSSHGRRSWAFTAWEVTAHYDLTPDKRGCRVTEPRAQLEIVTTLPRWLENAGASWRLLAQWKKMFSSLLAHERTHQEHAHLAARTTVANLLELPPQASCPAADRAAQRALQGAVAVSRRLSLEFDRATHFGASEGVSLQPDREAHRHAAGFAPKPQP